jgi:hypothetical protein
MAHRVRTTNPRKVRKLWEEQGGYVLQVRRTGEFRWIHPAFATTILANSRRNDIPAVILCRLNQIITREEKGGCGIIGV